MSSLRSRGFAEVCSLLFIIAAEDGFFDNGLLSGNYMLALDAACIFFERVVYIINTLVR